MALGVLLLARLRTSGPARVAAVPGGQVVRTVVGDAAAGMRRLWRARFVRTTVLTCSAASTAPTAPSPWPLSPSACAHPSGWPPAHAHASELGVIASAPAVARDDKLGRVDTEVLVLAPRA
ncbi:hypothetical protein [Streptomyces sp. NRRL S-31]|uniref:hypothetical protein n=1 Tax=Streptomyces sp. NRRL S-31 TaxID=1463898 RepID=UPI0004C5739F|nr:hypothetical protein [Streptomyces sp. NRRL S-31]